MSALSTENGQIARRLWKSASEGSPDSVLDFHPEVVWRTYGQGPNAGEFLGIDAVLEYLEHFGSRAEDLRLDLVDVFSSDEGAVIQYRVQANRGPKDLENYAFLKLDILDGVVTDATVVPFDQEKGAAFWRFD